jgi:hippurate hydrolase
LPEDKLPEVILASESTPAVVNDMRLGERIRAAWIDAFGAEAITAKTDPGMGGEDFSRFMVAPTKSAIYWSIGGTAAADIEAARAGGPAIASHHSPLFKIAAEPSVRLGVESTVVALLELMGD